MGTTVLQNTTLTTTANMKLFLIAALLIASACAEPESEGEAKPWLAYSNYGYPAYGYAGYAGYAGHYGYAGYPYAHAAYAAPVATTARYVAPYYNTYGLGYAHALGKRSADSDSEAKPDAWYNYYGNAYGYPYANGYNGYALPYARTYAGYGYGLRSYARWW